MLKEKSKVKAIIIKDSLQTFFREVKWKFNNVPIKEIVGMPFRPKIEINVDTNRSYPSQIDIKDTNINIKESSFILIRPTGLIKLDEIKLLLNKQNINIKKEYDIDDFRPIELTLSKNKYKAYGWFQYLEEYLPKELSTKAKMLIIDEADMEKVAKAKRKIRKALGFNFFAVNINGDKKVTSVPPVHSSDPKDLKKEFLICMKCVKMQ